MMQKKLLKHYQESGFSPDQVLWLFEEMRFASSGLMVNESKTHPEDVQVALAMRTRLKEALSNIKKPEDIEKYKKDWIPLLLNKESSLITMDDKIALAKQLLNPSSNHINLVLGEYNREELLERMSSWNLNQKTQMDKDVEDSEPDWDDVEAVLENRTLKWGAKSEVSDPSSSLEEAQQKLQSTLQETGVAMVSWPFVHHNDIEVLDKIRVGLKEANQDLVHRFGLKKDTPLLGMNGNTGIALGFEDDNGGTCYSEKGFCVLNLNAAQGWQVLAHEWFHGFDGWAGHLMGLNGFASEYQGTESSVSKDFQEHLKNWRQLIKGLQGSHESEKNTLLWEELKETWVNRWSQGMPHLLKEVKEEAQKMKSKTWNADESSKRWTAIFERINRPNAYLAAQMLVGELELIRNHSAYMKKTPSYMFRQKFDERIKGDKKYNWAVGYFDNPCELLAHNFESGFSENSKFIDAVAGKTTLRYPLKSEAQQQQLFWRRFFQEMKPFLEKNLKPKSSVSSTQLDWSNMRDKIAASRNLSASSNTNITPNMSSKS